MNVADIVEGGLVNYTCGVVNLGVHVEGVDLVWMIEVVQHLGDVS